MSFVGLLATTTLISLVSASATAEQHRPRIPLDHDHYFLVLLLNRRDFGIKTKDLSDPSSSSSSSSPNSGSYAPGKLDSSYDEDTGSSVGGSRDKRIGSLSIVNSVDVLRQRVLLELARRQAMEDQRQISENRRLLDSVGKRSGDNGYQYRLLRRREPQAPYEDREGGGGGDEGRLEGLN